MDNNDRLIRLRYALDIKNKDMIEIFKLGGVEVTKEELLLMLTKSKDSFDEEADYEDNQVENDGNIKIHDVKLEAFLNGLIIFKRGRQDPKPGQPENTVAAVKSNESINNIMLKRLKIALTLTSEDMLEIFEGVGIFITKGEVSALLRKEGHKNYKECGDMFTRNFLKGLAFKYRT